MAIDHEMATPPIADYRLFRLRTRFKMISNSKSSEKLPVWPAFASHIISYRITAIQYCSSWYLLTNEIFEGSALLHHGWVRTRLLIHYCYWEDQEFPQYRSLINRITANRTRILRHANVEYPAWWYISAFFFFLFFFFLLHEKVRVSAIMCRRFKS